MASSRGNHVWPAAGAPSNDIDEVRLADLLGRPNESAVADGAERAVRQELRADSGDSHVTGIQADWFCAFVVRCRCEWNIRVSVRFERNL
ncbi:hypothetical protein [Burkholderia singularis]|uniref:hypothetical protein n=1 Tax=Burkholderia singularis TaxID=1503053 RepID=UPI000F7B3042|nr:MULTISPECIES: hypothetical protein [Burkholderia]